MPKMVAAEAELRTAAPVVALAEAEAEADVEPPEVVDDVLTDMTLSRI